MLNSYCYIATLETKKEFRLVQNVIWKLFTNYIYLIYMYKQYLPLNHRQWLMCHKTQPNLNCNSFPLPQMFDSFCSRTNKVSDELWYSDTINMQRKSFGLWAFDHVSSRVWSEAATNKQRKSSVVDIKTLLNKLFKKLQK